MPCEMGTRKRLRELQETAARGSTESKRKTQSAVSWKLMNSQEDVF